MSVVAVIPAAGSSKRAGTAIPKQFLKFNGKELIAYTLLAFQQNPGVDAIVVATSEPYVKLLKRIKKKYSITKLTGIVLGGKERQDSVYNALASLSLNKKDIVAVHDAARPLLPQSVLTTAITAAQKKGNAIVCLSARDTLLRTRRKKTEYPDRSEYHYVQTPQVFRYADLLYAMELGKKDKFKATDESMLAQRAGFTLNIVEGSMLNFKVTTAEDVALFRKLCKAKKLLH